MLLLCCTHRWGLLLPVVYVVATQITNVIFKDALVLRGPCPNCNTDNFTYFGNILTVPGNRGTNAVSAEIVRRSCQHACVHYSSACWCVGDLNQCSKMKSPSGPTLIAGRLAL